MILGSYIITCDIKLDNKSKCTNRLTCESLWPTGYGEAVAFAIQKGWASFTNNDERNIFICKEHIGWVQ